MQDTTKNLENTNSPEAIGPVYHFCLLDWRKVKIEATGYDTKEGFIICAGSTAVQGRHKQRIYRFPVLATQDEDPMKRIRITDEQKPLVENGVLVIGETFRRFLFTRDYLAGTADYAAAIILGAPVSAEKSWMTEEMKPYSNPWSSLLSPIGGYWKRDAEKE